MSLVYFSACVDYKYVLNEANEWHFLQEDKKTRYVSMDNVSYVKKQ